MPIPVHELEERLRAMGFTKVDETPGWLEDYKWRHRSMLHRGKGLGSIWVKHDTFNVNGKRRGGYQRVLMSWVAPTEVNDSLANPFAVWTGPELVRLIELMETRVFPATAWPP